MRTAIEAIDMNENDLAMYIVLYFISIVIYSPLLFSLIKSPLLQLCKVFAITQPPITETFKSSF
jgi:hypothetical protein